MKKILKRLTVLFIAVSMILTFSVAPLVASAAPSSSVKLSASKGTVYVGTSMTLSATASPSGSAIVWSSSNAKVATVTQDGVVTGVKKGSAYIYAKIQDTKIQAKCKVTVSGPTITMSESKATIYVGITKQLSAAPAPDASAAIVWSTSNKKVATVSQDGVVTGVKKGTAYIYAKIQGTKITTKCRVTVSGPTVVMGESSSVVYLGYPKQLTAITAPDPSAAVVWSTSNKKVATVSADGVVTGIKKGTAYIYAKLQSTGKKVKCKVTIKDPIMVSNVAIDQTSVVLNVGASQKINAGVNPSNATNKELNYVSYDASVVSVSADGTITGVSEGTTVVSATTKDGSNKSAMISVAVKNVPVSNINVDSTSVTLLKNETKQITATASPDNATNKSIRFSSSNASVATVTDAGLITAVDKGSAVITVAAADGSDKTAQVNVTVTEISATGITASVTNSKILQGQSAQIKVDAEPAGAAMPALTYTSSDTLAATVSKSGVITPVAKGPATITVTSADGKLSSSFDINVEWADWQEKPRTVVTTDGEVDDMDSFKRLLLYTNDLDIEAIILNSSKWHSAGDPDANPPVQANRWNGTTWVLKDIDQYEESYKNLMVHDSHYPTPNYLRSIYKIGNIKTVGDVTHDTEGSNYLKALLLDNDPRPIHLQTWGGTNTIGRALMSIQEQYENTPQWEEIKAKVSAKTTIYIIQDQDGIYASYVTPNWPDIKVLYDSNNFQYFAYQWGNTTANDGQKLEAAWMTENIKFNHGSLLEDYWTLGDGQLLPGEPDNEQRGLPTRATGASKTTTKYAFISEGDSPSYIYLFDWGLRSQEDPSWGGLAGRFFSDRRTNEYRDQAFDYNSQMNSAGTAVIGWQKQYTLAKWFNALQSDFGARADWLVTPKYEDANHAPSISIEEGLNLTAVPGQRVTLTADMSDPDGDTLTLKWWQYAEADTYKEKNAEGLLADGSVSGRNGAPQTISFITSGKTGTFFIPSDAQDGDTIHVIAEVSDSGAHNLTRYQRVVVTVHGTNEVGIRVPDSVSNVWSSEDKTFYGTGTTYRQTFVATYNGTDLPTGNPNTTTRPRSASFSSSNTAVATVTTAGVITPVAAGYTTITATVAYVSGPSIVSTMMIRVVPRVTNIALAAPVGVDTNNIGFVGGSTVALTATVTPDNASTQAVTWTSSDTNIATVSNSGVVTQVAPGTVTVTATATDGSGVTGTINLTFVQPVTSIALAVPGGVDKDNISFAGGTVQLTPTVLPVDATNPSVTWSTSDAGVATVDTAGLVTLVSTGTVTITATAADGSGISGTITMTIVS